MTDKEKLDKLIDEIKGLIGDYNIKTEKYRGMNEQAHQYYGGKRDALSEILKSIVSMQEYPKDKCKGCNNVKGCITCVDGSEYAHIEECNITGIKVKHATGKLKELVDNVSEEGLEEARKQLEELTKECIYSKDNYTDEDRKALCEGCEEECKYIKLNTMLDDVLSKETKESWNKLLDEDSESEDIKEAYESYTDSRLVLLRPDIADMSCNRATKMSFDVFDGSELEAAFYEGAKWQKEQIKNRAIWCEAHPEDGEIWGCFDIYNLRDGEKVKVIIIKKE